MLLMEGVHSYQRSTSLSISQTASADAAIETSCSMIVPTMKLSSLLIWMLAQCNSNDYFLKMVVILQTMLPCLVLRSCQAFLRSTGSERTAFIGGGQWNFDCHSPLSKSAW